MWEQKEATQSGLPVLWDYHAFLMCWHQNQWKVWDLDTTLGVPVPMSTYLNRTFRPRSKEHDLWAPLFRIVEGRLYRERFSSDRMHMQKPDGSWLAPPPKWRAQVQPSEKPFLQWTIMTNADCDVLGFAEMLAMTF